MSIKFRQDGAVFPTSVSNGNLNIHLGNNVISVPFGFLKQDFSYDSTGFPMSNIMCYLTNGIETIIMRFDGTVTKYNKDNVVVGFTKFNRQDIYDKTNYYPFGILEVKTKNGMQNIPCAFYSPKGVSQYLYFDSGWDIEPMELLVSENKGLVIDITKGTRVSPRLKKVDTYTYVDCDNGYTIVGKVLKCSKQISI